MTLWWPIVLAALAGINAGIVAADLSGVWLIGLNAGAAVFSALNCILVIAQGHGCAYGKCRC